jgi:hydroxymethylbilane synthase
VVTEHTIRIGSRGSDLALWQSRYVVDLLSAAYPNLHIEIRVFSTRGDQVLGTPLPLIGGKGVFTAELEAALREGVIDLAVHSLKDLPTENPRGLTVGAVPRRAAISDVLVSRGQNTLNTLPKGAVVGTSSRRRAAQLLAYRPDLQTADIRGNVETRIRKVLDPSGPYDAAVLAQAGLDRLGLGDAISEVLPLDLMLPAPGQGALGIQCRDEPDLLALLAPVDDIITRLAVTAERAFLAGLGGGCSVPVAACAEIENGALRLRGRVSAIGGSQQIDVNGQIASLTVEAAAELGFRLADEAKRRGAAAILEAGYD